MILFFKGTFRRSIQKCGFIYNFLLGNIIFNFELSEIATVQLKNDFIASTSDIANL